MLDVFLMLQVKLSVVDNIHPQSNKFAMGVKNKATGDSKLHSHELKVNSSQKSLKIHTTISPGTEYCSTKPAMPTYMYSRGTLYTHGPHCLVSNREGLGTSL